LPPPTNHSSSQKTKINVLSYSVKIWTDLSSVLSGITRVTDGQTDGRTDRQTEFSSLYRVCITCSVVKKNLYFNVSITSRELQTSRLGLVSNFNVSSRFRLGWWSQRLGLVSVSSFYVSCPSLPLGWRGTRLILISVVI